MAITALPGGTWIWPLQNGSQWQNWATSNGGVMDGANESQAFIGRISLTTGPGTSKTFDTTSKIHWKSGSPITWGTANSTLKLGLQGVSGTTGLEDDTWSVYAELVQGSDAIAASTLYATTMESGSTTITHGDLIALQFELTVKNGSDSVIVTSLTANGILNMYVTRDTNLGAGSSKVTGVAPFVAIEFADGTIGYFGEPTTLPVTPTANSVSSASNPDEFCLVFSPPIDLQVDAIGFVCGEIDTTEDTVFSLVSDPLGSPSVLDSVTPDPDVLATGSTTTYALIGLLSSAVTLTGGSTYGIAALASTAGSRDLRTLTIPSANLRNAYTFGTTLQGATRNGGTGVYGNASTTVLAIAGLRVCGLQTPGSAGGGHILGGTVVR